MVLSSDVQIHCGYRFQWVIVTIKDKRYTTENNSVQINRDNQVADNREEEEGIPVEDSPEGEGDIQVEDSREEEGDNQAEDN